MDNLINEALGKMMRNSVPVDVCRYKYEIIRLEAEISQRQTAKKAGKLTLIKRATRRPIDKRIKGLREAIGRLSLERLNGVMTPLREQDLWQCRYIYTAKYNTMRKQQLKKGLEGDDLQADQEALEVVCESALITAQVQFSLKKKKKVKDHWVQLLTFEEASRLDPGLINELWAIYCEHLVLSADQLKPSAVSTNQSDQETTKSSEDPSKSREAASSGSSSPTS